MSLSFLQWIIFRKNNKSDFSIVDLRLSSKKVRNRRITFKKSELQFVWQKTAFRLPRGKLKKKKSLRVNCCLVPGSSAFCRMAQLGLCWRVFLRKRRLSGPDSFELRAATGYSLLKCSQKSHFWLNSLFDARFCAAWADASGRSDRLAAGRLLTRARTGWRCAMLANLKFWPCPSFRCRLWRIRGNPGASYIN